MLLLGLVAATDDCVSGCDVGGSRDGWCPRAVRITTTSVLEVRADDDLARVPRQLRIATRPALRRWREPLTTRLAREAKDWRACAGPRRRRCLCSTPRRRVRLLAPTTNTPVLGAHGEAVFAQCRRRTRLCSELTATTPLLGTDDEHACAPCRRRTRLCPVPMTRTRVLRADHDDPIAKSRARRPLCAAPFPTTPVLGTANQQTVAGAAPETRTVVLRAGHGLVLREA